MGASGDRRGAAAGGLSLSGREGVLSPSLSARCNPIVNFETTVYTIYFVNICYNVNCLGRVLVVS